jgi:hypothetical protein
MNESACAEINDPCQIYMKLLVYMVRENENTKAILFLVSVSSVAEFFSTNSIIR